MVPLYQERKSEILKIGEWSKGWVDIFSLKNGESTKRMETSLLKDIAQQFYNLGEGE